ncbi:MAG: class I SAM-dependent RNA methyltransferase [Gemmatimonadales bacterium]|nr:class I SAM-dependent RNA methyltransferase [Gemmatimonadales bacterium]
MTTDILAIDRIAAGGVGVGRLSDGRVAFVPRTAPGDRVEMRVMQVAPRFVRGRLVRIVEPGPDRTEPGCAHYVADECGGCQLQHLPTEAQRTARRAIVGDAIRRIGKLSADDPPLVPAASEWGYRAKISLTRRPDGAVGYHRYDRPGEVFPVRECPIAAPGVNRLLARLRQSRPELPRHLSRLVLRLDRSGAEHVVVETGEGPVWQGGRALHAAVKAEAPLTIWWRQAGEAPRAVAGSDSAYPPTAFEQVNPVMGDRVRAAAIERLGAVGGRSVWDLYAGIGETSSLLAERGADVVSVEWDRSAVAEAARRQARYGRQIERIAGAVERVIGSLGRPDRVVVNPPRTGMATEVVDGLRERGPDRIVYVSCDPATLGRDLARLVGRGPPAYRLVSLEAFDLFPQTAHVETVAVMERA